MMNKAQQLRIATALAGVAVPPKGAAMVRQADQEQRVDRVAPQASDRAIKRAEAARKASCSVRTTSGGGQSAPASGSKGSVRDDIRAVMDR